MVLVLGSLSACCSRLSFQAALCLTEKGPYLDQLAFLKHACFSDHDYQFAYENNDERVPRSFISNFFNKDTINEFDIKSYFYNFT